jgi:glutamate dehydrogenase/leucine dehydrogenase
MSHKNALAGLWWGGGKGVIARNSGDSANAPMDPAVRQVIYKEYGQFMTALKGCYITAEDAGTSLADMATIFSMTRFTTCIPTELGGSGMPSLPTSQGVLRGIAAAFDFLGLPLEGSSIAVQGGAL